MTKSRRNQEFTVNGRTYEVISSEGIISIKEKIKKSTSNDFIKILNAEYANLTKNKSISIPTDNNDKIIWKVLGASRRSRKITRDDLLDYFSQVEKDYNKARESNTKEELANSTPSDIKKLIKATEAQNAKVVSNLQEITNSINAHMDKIHKDNLKQIRDAKESSKSASDQAQEASKQAEKSIKIASFTMKWTIIACIATIISCFATIVFGCIQCKEPKNNEEQKPKNIAISEPETNEESQFFEAEPNKGDKSTLTIPEEEKPSDEVSSEIKRNEENSEEPQVNKVEPNKGDKSTPTVPEEEKPSDEKSYESSKPNENTESE